MNYIQRVFDKSRVFLPVIHFKNKDEFLRSVDIAVNAGADGLFFIKQGGISMNDLDIYIHAVHLKYPKIWKGVNYLCDNTRALSRIHNHRELPIHGLWVDNAMIEEDEDNIQIEADQFRDKMTEGRKAGKWMGLYFGGVAFKYQKPVKNIDFVARVAREYMDVITTSGDGTGKAAKADKVITFRKAIEDHALALASGVTCSNVKNYLPYVNAFLVATGIEDDFGVLNEEKTNKLSRLIHDYK
jgi:hypothetical protein